MGQTISYDFCSVVRQQLLTNDVDFNDQNIWKTLFTTDMSDREIAMYLSWNAVRLMRRNKPHNLAMLIYKCMQQLGAFLDKSTLPGATVVHRPNMHSAQQQQVQGDSPATAATAAAAAASESAATSGGSSSVAVGETAGDGLAAADSFVDPCAAQNAIRMLTMILPAIYEPEIRVEKTPAPEWLEDEDDDASPFAPTQDDKAKQKKKNKGADDLIETLLAQPESPFAAAFAQCFLEQNLRCDPRQPAAGFPPLFAENAKLAQQSGWDKNKAGDGDSPAILPVALGSELVVLLTRLCFVPGFSVEYGAISTSAMRFLRGVTSENAQCGHDVVVELLDSEGLFRQSNNNSTPATTNNTSLEHKDEDGDEKNKNKKTDEKKKNNNNNSSSSALSGKIYNTVFSFDVLNNRVMLLRCLLVALCKNAMTGKAIPRPRDLADSQKTGGAADVEGSLNAMDSLRACFVDCARNPLALTLVVSCLNYVCTYVSRGVVPFSSHYFARVPEMMLGKCMEFLAVVLTPPSECCLADLAGGAGGNNNNNNNDNSTLLKREYDHFVAAASRSRNSLWLALSHIMHAEPVAAPFVVSGLCTVLNNPVYAQATTLRGSQKVIDSAHEAAQLLWTLCIVPGTRQTVLPVLGRACIDSIAEPDHFGGAYVIMGLLRIVLRSLEERRHVGNAQASLWLLLLLSSQPDFAASLRKPLVRGMCPLTSLENLNKSGSTAGSTPTVGDALVLALCELTCPAAPRWLLPLTELTTSILANVVPQLRSLMEMTQFELFHLLEWITGQFLAVQRKSVNQDSCLLAVVDMFVNAAQYQPLSFKPLVASLATEVKVSERLQKVLAIEPRDPSVEAAPVRIDASFVEKLAQGYVPTPAVRSNLKFDAFCILENVAVEKMNQSSGGGDGVGDKAAAAAADPYSVLDSAIPYFSASDDADGSFHVRSTQPSMELLRWGTSQAWAMIMQLNILHPLLDLSKAKMFTA